MTLFPRAARILAFLAPLFLFAIPAALPAQEGAPAPRPLSLQPDDPWIYRGTDIPVDPEWVFGEMDNGLRYAVRRNSVPPDQVSIRIRIDAGSLHETVQERGFAHLMEHLTFRQSKYLGQAEAIPTWQRLGATFGSDTNAETSSTATVYKLDLPNAAPPALEESFRLLSGMIREPVLSQANLDTEVPIVLAEKRERGGPGLRVMEATRETFYAGQPLAERGPIGTEATLRGATAEAMQAFHARWYRPENTVIVAVGDADPMRLAALIEQWFGSWQGQGPAGTPPDFGQPAPPPGADPANPVGKTTVLVEPDLPRMVNYAVLRPYEQVVDNLEYNRGLMIDAIAQALINRRLESRARAGGSYLFAQVRQDDVSRSTDGTFVSITPLGEDWRAALRDVRAVIADAMASPPSEEEIARELAEYDVFFVSQVAERAVMSGAKLADDIMQAVDIREAVATPETVLEVFRDMRERFTPEAVLEQTRAMFSGVVIRAMLVTPEQGEASDAALKAAMLAPVEADNGSRIKAKAVSFDELPPIGAPGEVVSALPTGLLQIEQVEFANGVRALLWPNDAEPGRVQVKVRFGSGYRGFSADNAVYASLGQTALVSSGLGSLGEEELDRISSGRKMGFDFAIEDAVFAFGAETREADLADQLYLFAAKLAMPRWDENPILRAKAAAQLQYESYATSPGGVLERDLQWLLGDRDPRFATPSPKALAGATPAGFRKAWAPLLEQGPVEVMLFGDFNRDAAVAALARTFGALAPRKPIPAQAAGRVPDFPEPNGKPLMLHHRGDANQAAAVVAWPTGGGVDGVKESRQLEVLTQLFNNRLLEAMREHSGASYSPRVSSNWPVDLPDGGRLVAVAQLEPEAAPAFFDATEKIAADLAANPVGEDELARVTEPLRQLISRASTGNMFWMYNLEGASFDPQRIALLRSLLNDYTQISPERIQELAARYLAARSGWRLAVMPQEQGAKPAAGR